MKHWFPACSIGLFMVATSVNWSPDVGDSERSGSAATNGHGTTVSAVLDAPIPDRQNLLWCATFQMAWDAAAKRIGAPIRLLPPVKLADQLNRHPFDLRQIDSKSAFVAGGSVDEGILTTIRQGLRAQSGRDAKLTKYLDTPISGRDLVFYAMLHKEMEFAEPFGRLGSWSLGGHKVPCFGFKPDQINKEKLLKQVKVHHYKSKDDFVIELLGKEQGDQLLLSKIPLPGKSLKSASDNMLKQVGREAPFARANDLLVVPQVTVNELTSFSGLEGCKVAGPVDRVLRKALQSIEFKMNEKGVKLDSEAMIQFGCAVHPRLAEPRMFVLNPPFLLLMKRHDSTRPYFVGWFGNADLLRSE